MSSNWRLAIYLYVVFPCSKVTVPRTSLLLSQKQLSQPQVLGRWDYWCFCCCCSTMEVARALHTYIYQSHGSSSPPPLYTSLHTTVTASSESRWLCRSYKARTIYMHRHVKQSYFCSLLSFSVSVLWTFLHNFLARYSEKSLKTPWIGVIN